MTTLHTHIMRRIYYAYILRLVLDTQVLLVISLAVTSFGLSYFVSITSVLRNLSDVRVGDVDDFMYDALIHTETSTLVLGSVALLLCGLFIRTLWTKKTTEQLYTEKAILSS